MFKTFGRSDLVKENDFTGNSNYSQIELYSTGDKTIAPDIERPIKNIFSNQSNLLKFIEEYINNLEHPNGIIQGFQMTDDDVVQVSLNGTTVNYIRVPPGVFILNSPNYTEEKDRLSPSIYVSQPDIRIAEREIAKILGMNLNMNAEQVEIKYLQNSIVNDSFKAKIIKKDTLSNSFKTYFFGCTDETTFQDETSPGVPTGISLLELIYNETDFVNLFDDAINKDLTKITLETIFEIPSATDYYLYISDTNFGKIDISLDSGTNNIFSHIYVSDISEGNLTATITNMNLNINLQRIIRSQGEDDDAILLDAPNGGITINSPLKFESSGTVKYYNSAPTLSGTEILGYDGYFYSTKIFNTDNNDLAEYFLSDSPKLNNHVYVISKNGKVKLSDKYGDSKVAGICSDSAAFLMKQEHESKGGVPLALAGTVNVKITGKLKVGDLITSYKFGSAKKANLFIKLFKREAIIGKVIKINDENKTAFVLVK